MANQAINLGIGTTGGDTLYDGAVKINSNFSEIYSAFGNGTSLVSYAKTSGVSTSSGYATIAGYSTSSGISTNSNYAVISGYSTSSGISTLSTTSNYAVIAGYSTNSGIASYAGYSPSSGVSTTSNYAIIAGYSTSSGIATYATTAGTAPASAANFTVGADLYVTGNISVGGTSAILNITQLQVKDRDIVVGYTTDGSNNDVSNETTANHGGISVASTVGNPILNIPLQSGINSNPTTYKQWMWVKSGNYSGLGTDVWLSNYAISIGNTSTVQNLSRLTVGAGFTVYDTYLDATDIKTRNINSTGIVTATSFSGSGANLTGIIAGVGIKTSAGLVGTGATILDFRGAGISTITVASGIATINITGSSATPDISPVMMSMIF
jgi:hypothetical protein